MPKALDDCVKSVKKGWRDKPDSQPDNVKGKGEKEMESAAFAICNSRLQQNWLEDRDVIQMQLDGHGPVLAGIGLTNRPFLKGLPVASIVEDGDEKRIRVPFYRLGRFSHPKAPDGKLIFDPQFLAVLKENFQSNTYGQKILLDKAHKPDDGNMGELERIDVEGDMGVGYFKPTQAGLEAVRQREYLYGSMDFFMNWKSNEISMSCSDEGFGEILLEDQVDATHYELFNPFHSKKDGRFTSGKGGSTKSGDAPAPKKKKSRGKAIAAVGGGIVAGSAIGSWIGSTTGLMAGIAFDVSPTAVASLGSVVGGIVGMAVGADLGMEWAGYTSEDADTIMLADEDAAVKTLAKNLSSALEAFLKKADGDAVFVLDKADSKLPFDKLGFKKHKGQWYIDKKRATKLNGALKKASGGSAKKEEATKMSEELENVEGTEVPEAEVTLSIDENAVVLTKEEYEQLMGDSTKLGELETNQSTMLAEIRMQKAELYRRDVDTFIQEASLPVDGKSFSKPVLEVVTSLLLNSPTGENESIQLSDDNKGDIGAVVKYFHDGVRYLLSIVPRDVPVEAYIKGRDERPLDMTRLGEDAEQETEELAAFALGVDLENTGEEE